MGITKILKQITGIQAYQDRKEAEATKLTAEKKYRAEARTTERLREVLNEEIYTFGQVRLESLKKTVGIFVAHLRDIEQRNKNSQYSFLDAIDVKQEKVEELKSLDMSASSILGGTVASAAVGAVALSGVPAAVTGAVTTFAAASTGTAISSLSGVAASNATLAFLGGGTLAAGGGGVAAGATVLAAATYTATCGAAIIVAGLIASAHYSKKLTEAKEYEKEVDIEVAKMEKARVAMEGIRKRIEELKDVTQQLNDRTIKELKYLTPLIPDFDSKDIYCVEMFQRAGLLVKAVGELAKQPLLDEAWDLSDGGGIVVRNIRTLLGSQL